MDRGKRHKLLLPVLLAGMVLLPLLLLFCLQTLQYILKETAEQRLRPEQEHTLYLPANSVQWEEEGRELVIDGRYFDVSRTEVRGSLLLIYGHYDDWETGVFLLLQKAVRHSSGNLPVSRLLLLLQCLIVLSFAKYPVPVVAVPVLFERARCAVYFNPYIGCIAPPPWQSSRSMQFGRKD